MNDSGIMLNIICLGFLILLLILYFSKKNMNNVENKVYKCLLIDDLFLIAKNIKNENAINENENDQDNEYYNYDIYIADSFICVTNYHIYDVKNDQNYSKIISEFLSILSSCIEFILYVLKNKDIYIPKFIYAITYQACFL